jgi:hypothetical protein
MDKHTGKTTAITCRKLLLCTPQFVNKHLLGDARPLAYNQFNYAPWVVANITLNNLPGQNGYPLCWDNVIFGTQSVGYVYANHQNLKQPQQGVLTYYLPFPGSDTAQTRRNIQSEPHSHWVQLITTELEKAHRGISNHITNIDVWVWGHGMICPSPGFIWGETRKQAAKPVADKIFFAHTDLSGISIFEEAFYQGIRAANQIINSL